MTARLPILALAVSLLAAAPACAAPALTHLPARFRGNDVFLPVGIDGNRPLWMKLDIDSAASSVSPGLHGSPHAMLRIGSVEFPDVALRTDTAPASLGPDGKPLAGILGIDALGDRPLWIDTRRKQVWISDPPPVPQPLRTAGVAL